MFAVRLLLVAGLGFVRVITDSLVSITRFYVSRLFFMTIAMVLFTRFAWLTTLGIAHMGVTIITVITTVTIVAVITAIIMVVVIAAVVAPRFAMLLLTFRFLFRLLPDRNLNRLGFFSVKEDIFQCAGGA